MTNWITYVSDDEWKSKTASGLIANQDAARSAEKVGFKPLFYPRFNANLIKNEGWGERQARIEAIISGVKPGDTVIVQYPTWINFMNFDMQFFDALKKIENVKTAALVWDILSWVHDDSDRDYSGDPSLWMLNKFDVVIAANPKMAHRLREEGGVHRPILAMGITDIPYEGPLTDKTFEKRLYYVSTAINPSMIEDYTAKTPFYFIGPDWAVKEHPDHVHMLGQKMTDELPAIFEGGFGVVSYGRGGTYKGMLSYGEYNNPMKLSMYISSGLPPVVTSSSAHAGWVKDRGIGIVLDDLNEIDEVFDKMTETDYHEMLERLRPWQKAVSSGHFTQRACLEAVRIMRLGFTDSLSEI